MFDILKFNIMYTLYNLLPYKVFTFLFKPSSNFYLDVMVRQSEELGLYDVNSYKKPNILILGHARHGKDEVAILLNELCGFNYVSSSEKALPYIFPALQLIKGYKTEQEALEDKFDNRDLWKVLIKLLNVFDKAALCKDILSVVNIYVGLRCELEFEEVLTQGLFDVIIWVDGSKRKPLEPSMKIQYDSNLMYLLDNNGNKEELLVNVKKMIEDLNLK